MTIEYSKSAIKALQNMEKKRRNAIHNAILGLTEQPPKGDVKPLEGYTDKRYRLRVGSYRIVFRYNEHGSMVILFVIDIGSRGDIYK